MGEIPHHKMPVNHVAGTDVARLACQALKHDACWELR